MSCSIAFSQYPGWKGSAAASPQGRSRGSAAIKPAPLILRLLSFLEHAVMPFVEITTVAQGKTNIHYELSTPLDAHAPCLDKNLPTLLLLHAEYVALHIFHPQFDDPRLRRFNLVAMDFRAHGETSGLVSTTYAQEAAAEDVIKFMDAIRIESCCLVGLSMGTIIALQVAVNHPERVNLLFLVSPLGTEEPRDVSEGRQQVHNTWLEAFPDLDRANTDSDRSAVDDTAFGVLQYAVNNAQSPLYSALTSLGIEHALRHRGGVNVEFHQVMTVNFMKNRKGHSIESLSKIKCPVKLVHCMQSVAFDLAYTNLFFQHLKEASVAVTLETIDAPHFGTVARPDLINPMLADFVIQNTTQSIPPAPEHVVSPLEAVLVEHGLPVGGGSDDDTD